MAKQPIASTLMLPAREIGVPAGHWLREGIRRSILDGHLPAGTRLPSTREIAKQHGFARGTVVLAMNQLRSEGYIESARGSGTFVSDALPERLLQVKVRRQPQGAGMATPTELSAYARQVRPFSYFVEARSLAFRTNLPALDLFPTTLWAQVNARRIRTAPTSLLLSCDPAGYRPFRMAIAEQLREARGVVCDPDQIVVTSGVQEGLELTARLLLNPGDAVLVEDPGFQGAYAAFGANGAEIVPVGVDTDGCAPTREQIQQARLLYVTPAHQFPTGVTMSLRRRMELLCWAREAGTMIFEDDYDSDFRYSGRPVPAILGLDRNERVILAGSFNKVMFPALRLGYLVLPQKLVAVFAGAKAISTRQQPLLAQAAMSDFLRDGHFGTHVRRMRKVYAERLQCLVHHAHARLAGALALSTIEAGLQTMGCLAAGLDAAEVASAAAARRIDVVPLCRYTHAAAHAQQALQIGFAAVDEHAIEYGVRELERAVGSVVHGRPRFPGGPASRH